MDVHEHVANSPNFNVSRAAPSYVNCELNHPNCCGRHVMVGDREQTVSLNAAAILEHAEGRDHFTLRRSSDLDVLKVNGIDYAELGDGRYKIVEEIILGNHFRRRLKGEFVFR